jgi:polyhydroxyalkanoate synthesis regulator phasin
MTEEAKDFMPEQLRAIRKDLADMRREINGCLLAVEQHVVALSTDVTNTNARLTRIEDRLALIEKRLTKST